MSHSNEESDPPVRITLKGIAYVVVILSVCCAVTPVAALFVVGATPVAIGFIVFVIGDQRCCEWMSILGVMSMAVGLGIGALLMAMVQSVGQ